MTCRPRWLMPVVLLTCVAAGLAVGAGRPASQPAPAAASGKPVLERFVEEHCLGCHDSETRTGGLALDALLPAEIGEHAEVWEKVVRRLTAGEMPPKDMPRPDERSHAVVVSWLESSLDRAAAARPDPGRTETFRRLTRAEYRNAIRDLLALEVDVESLLPPDESSHGFDNVTVGDLSPMLLNRYLSAAEKISRLAVGGAGRGPASETFRVRPDITQDTHIEGLPIGTRGGVLIPYQFPQDGAYEIQVHLMRDRNEEIEGLSEPHELEVLLDRERVGLFTIKPPPRGESDRSVDADLKVRLDVTAGPHQVGVAFLNRSASLLETMRQPLNVHFNYYRHPRIGPAVYQVTVSGPFDASGPGDTPSRRRILTCRPSGPEDEEDCARRILSSLMRRAWRRPIDDEDLKTPMKLFREGRREGFEAGIERALAGVLVSPQFLFRIEREPEAVWHDAERRDAVDGRSAQEPAESGGLVAATRRVAPHRVYRVSDVELASRLSFFVWSSIPDEELLDLAERGELSRPGVLEAQARRMLADDRSRSLVTSFAGQWLYLRNLDSVTPDMRLFPDFDDNLRQAFRRETELFFESVVREDRSVLDLIRAEATWLNERLARHYGIPHVYGSRFRRVPVDEESQRGGLLRQGSLLTVTSYATRTSPVIRGQWVLKNLLGSPPPPPPADVPALEDNSVSADLPVRERLAEHRANAACASCHELMDPVGFALESFDAVGRWRKMEAGRPIDASGGLPDGREFTGVGGLEQALVERPELFVRTLAEKLLTFALGRGVEYYDGPAIRKIVREARDEDVRFSALIVGVVKSTPFQMRRAE